MKPFGRRTLTGISLIVVSMLALSAVVVIRALTTRSVQLAVRPVEKLGITDRAIERVAGAIRIPNVSRSGGSPSDLVAIESLHRYLETCFPLVHKSLVREVVNGLSLLFSWKGEDQSAKPVLLIAHMDVVPVEPGTESSWTHKPFAGDIADGFVWGRGTLDDKVGVMAILEAVEVHLNRGAGPKRSILLAFGHDEELGGQSVRAKSRLS